MNKETAHPYGTKIVLACILFFVGFSMTPTFYEWNARGRIRPERFFELVHNFPTDYNLYLSRIREGKEGAWLATEKYTSEPHAPSLSQIMYVLIGRLADYSHIQTPYVWFAYHVARVFFSAFLLWVIWLVARWAMAEKGFYWQFITFLLIVTQSTWPKFELVQAVPRLGGWMPWYTMADSMQRTTFMPHVMFAQGLLVFILWVLSGGFITKKLPGNFVFLGIVGLVLGIIFPPGLLFIYGVIGIVTAAEIVTIVLSQKKDIQTKLKVWFVRDVFGRVVFGLVSAPSLMYFYLLLSQYPWKRLAEFDVLHPTAFSFVEYFMAMGAVLPLGLLGIVALVLVGKADTYIVVRKLKLFIYWVVAWLGFLFIFDKIPQQSPTRFTQMAPHVPLGILTAYLFYLIVTFVQSRLFQFDRKSQYRVLGIVYIGKEQIRSVLYAIRNTLYAIPFVIVLFGMASMASSYMWLQDFVDHKLRATIPLVPHGAEVMYPLYDIVDALVWLQVYAPRSAIVLSGSATGNYIPVYSGNTAFVGHANTVQSEIKIAALENFYHRRLSLSEEMDWIRQQNISYILYGPEEAEMSNVSDLKILYPDLVEVYKNATVRVYKTP